MLHFSPECNGGTVEGEKWGKGKQCNKDGIHNISPTTNESKVSVLCNTRISLGEGPNTGF